MKKYTLEELLKTEQARELDWETTKVVEAILECYTVGERDKEVQCHFFTIEDLEDAIERADNIEYYIDEDAFNDSMDDCLCFANPDSIEARYFDYEAYHRDCMFDYTEASNGVILGN